MDCREMNVKKPKPTEPDKKYRGSQEDIPPFEQSWGCGGCATNWMMKWDSLKVTVREVVINTMTHPIAGRS